MKINLVSRSLTRATLLITILGIIGCGHPQEGPDKTIGGAILGAGWGAGAGAVVGNQVSAPGAGAAVGAGLGAVSGIMTGVGMDAVEETQVEQEKELAALRIQTLANQKELSQIQASLDDAVSSIAGVHQVYFDSDTTNIRSGSVAQLEILADAIKKDPGSRMVRVVGHADDSGDPEYNARVAEARARTVASYLAARGLSMDQIKVESVGSKEPVASNSTPEGRQLNRRVDVMIVP